MKNVLAAAMALSLALACTPSAPNAVPPSPNASAPASQPGSSVDIPFKTWTYGMSTESMGFTTSGTMTTEILSLTDTSITVKTTTSFGGQTNTVTTTANRQDGVTPGAASDFPLTDAGTESVTVKAGTFNAVKKTGSKDGVEATYWFAEDMMVKGVTKSTQQGMTVTTTIELIERK